MISLRGAIHDASLVAFIELFELLRTFTIVTVAKFIVVTVVVVIILVMYIFKAFPVIVIDILEQMTRQLWIIYPNIGRPCPFWLISMSLLPAAFSDSICIPQYASTSITLILIPFSPRLAGPFLTFGLLGQPCAT